MGTIQTNTTKQIVCISTTHVNFWRTETSIWETFIQLFVWLTLAYCLQPVVSVSKLKPSLKISVEISKYLYLSGQRPSCWHSFSESFKKNAILKRCNFSEIFTGSWMILVWFIVSVYQYKKVWVIEVIKLETQYISSAIMRTQMLVDILNKQHKIV